MCVCVCVCVCVCGDKFFLWSTSSKFNSQKNGKNNDLLVCKIWNLSIPVSQQNHLLWHNIAFFQIFRRILKKKKKTNKHS